MAAFSRLVRFVSDDGQTYYGDAILDDGEADIARARHARVIEGDIFGDHEVTDTCLVICQLLMPLEPADVGTVRCIGLNYGGHAEETQMKKPKYPLLFYKPRTALAGPSDDIIVPQMAQESPEVDYECELVIVTGKECRNVSEADALSHVLGYAVGNDVTHRDWQLKRGEGQWSHGKGFDTWGPFGPGIVTGQVIKDPQTLAISTAVNGNTLQKSNTADMLFSAGEIISLLSRGVTLMPGDVIFTGTPPGVGMCRNPPVWLQHGDVVTVNLENVGSCNSVWLE